MRLLERNPRLSGLMVGLAVLALAGVRAQAQLEVSSTEPGSIAVFPKVIADGTRDTIISLTNTSNLMAFVHCEATNGIGTCGGSPDPDNQVYYCNDDLDCLNVTDPAGGTIDNVGPCELDWQPSDFELALTAQQPTFWRVSTGRVQDPTLSSGDSCSPSGNAQICPGFFLSPAGTGAGANVPGAAGPFRGALRCFQVDMNGDLTPANSIKGEAFIERVTEATSAPFGADISGYNSINFEGGEPPAIGDESTARLNDVNYARCPDSLTFDNLAPGQLDPVSGADVEVEITFIPCSYNTAEPTQFVPRMFTYDELESEFSGGEPGTCWVNSTGSNTNNMAARSTTYLRTSAGASHTGNCDASSTEPPAFCQRNSDCGRDGICDTASNTCSSGSSVGRVCANDAGCGAGGTCGPRTNVIGVVETLYTGDSLSGSDINVMHQLGSGTVDNVMSFTNF